MFYRPLILHLRSPLPSPILASRSLILEPLPAMTPAVGFSQLQPPPAHLRRSHCRGCQVLRCPPLLRPQYSVIRSSSFSTRLCAYCDLRVAHCPRMGIPVGQVAHRPGVLPGVRHTLAPHCVPWHRPPGQVWCSAGVEGIATSSPKGKHPPGGRTFDVPQRHLYGSHRQPDLFTIRNSIIPSSSLWQYFYLSQCALRLSPYHPSRKHPLGGILPVLIQGHSFVLQKIYYSRFQMQNGGIYNEEAPVENAGTDGYSFVSFFFPIQTNK